MADRGTLEAIEKLKRQRPRQLLDMMGAAYDGAETIQESAKRLTVTGLRFLVENFRDQANLVMESGARGKGSEATALRGTASHLSLLADAVEKVDLAADDVEPTPSRGGPSIPAEWCGKMDEHGPHDWPLSEPAGPARHCVGRHTRDLSGLDLLVAAGAMSEGARARVTDRSGVKVITVPSGANGMIPLSEPITGPATVAFEFAEPQGGIYGIGPDGTGVVTFADPAEDLGVFGIDERPNGGMTVERVPMPDYLLQPNSELESWLRGDDVQPVAPARINTPELKAEAAVMFADPAPPGKPAEPVMPGRRLTFTELLAPPPVAPPAHMSHSQVTGMNCGVQYRLTRLEPGVVERPRWANVGGAGLHLAVEWFEKQVAKAPADVGYARARIEIAGGIGKIWTDHFGNAVVEQSMKTPGVPPSDWKESGRHIKEGYTWWLTQGEDMLRRYLDGRLAEIAASVRVIATGPESGSVLVEHEGVLDVDGVPLKVVIDQAWLGQFDGGAIVIEDVKSGAWEPDGTFQLGLYAWYLRKTLGWQGQILGRFWDARKGTYGEPVDLIEAHPWEEVQLRVLPEAAKKKALLFSPNPSFGGCKSCMVSHACPASKAAR